MHLDHLLLMMLMFMLVMVMTKVIKMIDIMIMSKSFSIVQLDHVLKDPAGVVVSDGDNYQ